MPKNVTNIHLKKKLKKKTFNLDKILRKKMFTVFEPRRWEKKEQEKIFKV